MTLEPNRFVTQLDRHLLQITEPVHYATLFLGVLDPQTHRLAYVNGGHPAALFVHADGSIQKLDPTDVPVGLVDRPDWTFESAEVDFPPGSVLIVVSDGITEAARNPEEEFFGEGRLESVLRGAPLDSAAAACTSIRQALDDFLGDVPRADDATMLVLRRLG
jgi:serine phosphatase RsbU (regulator of sigma subunit)